MPGVEEMVARVWPGHDAAIEVLGGGITNRNFKVTLVDGTVVYHMVSGRKLDSIDPGA